MWRTTLTNQSQFPLHLLLLLIRILLTLPNLVAYLIQLNAGLEPSDNNSPIGYEACKAQTRTMLTCINFPDAC